jgi:hypothetical protein
MLVVGGADVDSAAPKPMEKSLPPAAAALLSPIPPGGAPKNIPSSSSSKAGTGPPSAS